MSLLYNFLDELLFAFCGDDFVCKDVKVVEFDEARLRITVSCKGERFDLGKHPQVRAALAVPPAVHELLPRTHLRGPAYAWRHSCCACAPGQGTEVKAITYSNMQIHRPAAAGDAEMRGSAHAVASPGGEAPVKPVSAGGATAASSSSLADDGLFHVYVIIDI